MVECASRGVFPSPPDSSGLKVGEAPRVCGRHNTAQEGARERTVKRLTGD